MAIRAGLIGLAAALIVAGTAIGATGPTGSPEPEQAGGGDGSGLDFSFTDTRIKKLTVMLAPADPINGSKCNPPCTLEFTGALKVFTPKGKAGVARTKKFPFKPKTVTINDESLLEATARLKLKGGKKAVKKAGKLLKSKRARRKSSLSATMTSQGSGPFAGPPVILTATAKPKLR